MAACIVCGSTATIVRGRPDIGIPQIALCVAHEYVCRDHLADPCSICDTT